MADSETSLGGVTGLPESIWSRSQLTILVNLRCLDHSVYDQITELFGAQSSGLQARYSDWINESNS